MKLEIANSEMMNEINLTKEKYHEYFTLERKYNELRQFVGKSYAILMTACVVDLIYKIIEVF